MNMNMNSIFKAFAAACLASATSALEYPGDDCCTYWKDKNFTGDSKTVCHYGTSQTSSNIYNGFYQEIESIFCGKNVEFQFR